MEHRAAAVVIRRPGPWRCNRGCYPTVAARHTTADHHHPAAAVAFQTSGSSDAKLYSSSRRGAGRRDRCSAGRKSGFGDIVGRDHRRRVCDRGDQSDPARLGSRLRLRLGLAMVEFGGIGDDVRSRRGGLADRRAVAVGGVRRLSTGRLRTKWVSVHSDEVYFRDTAHGFLAWAVAAVITAAVLGSAVSSMIGAAARVAGPAAHRRSRALPELGPAHRASSALDPTAYLVDELFRTDHPDVNANPQPMRAEATPIIARGLAGRRSGLRPGAI